jgi:hypothetical protein
MTTSNAEARDSDQQSLYMQGRIRHERPWYLCVGSETWGEAVFNIQTLSNIIRNNGGVNVTDTLDSTCFVQCGSS